MVQFVNSKGMIDLAGTKLCAVKRDRFKYDSLTLNIMVYFF